ncbi:uncharacterized protein AMSG_04706 [Thecamonas trahens ATCC 50062]|uniref:Uncharacterized protein n=1 Tax=Thecamonas trahens ATCC 50062 TaxID=461836 RepID=A0A0L0DA38_THETB|nr:hypothetical protein AMSG_04706 [Thecamonas trahens ATCC 50062]KNC48961.1 hypothetical protein AMSG_04706 [Thecamonas trahens ATCC 50062]|eukprot:XP_013758378.1 hypothetical protein AMSG_04706 [Thecamonas trahens ATCC 50062]
MAASQVKGSRLGAALSAAGVVGLKPPAYASVSHLVVYAQTHVVPTLDALPGVDDVKCCSASKGTRDSGDGVDGGHETGPQARGGSGGADLVRGLHLEWSYTARKGLTMAMGRIRLDAQDDRVLLRDGGPGGADAVVLDADCAYGRPAMVVDSGEVWFQDLACDWWFIADSIAAWLRLALAALGIGAWMLMYTPTGLDRVTLQWMQIFAPSRVIDVQPRGVDEGLEHASPHRACRD